jgi:hypothetical protein
MTWISQDKGKTFVGQVDGFSPTQNLGHLRAISCGNSSGSLGMASEDTPQESRTTSEGSYPVWRGEVGKVPPQG